MTDEFNFEYNDDKVENKDYKIDTINDDWFNDEIIDFSDDDEILY